MPSLEILDLSYNKIKRLPSQPGSLQNLQVKFHVLRYPCSLFNVHKVFAVTHNRIHRIPRYFVQFRNLQLFKIEQNPLDWPPKDVMNPPSHPDDHETMKGWIHSIQNWMETNIQRAGERKESDDSIQTDASNPENDHDGSS